MQMTHEQLVDFVRNATAAQSMLLAAVFRPLIQSGALSEDDLQRSLSAVEQAALQRRTPEVPALTGLIDLLRQDLGLSARTGRDG